MKKKKTAKKLSPGAAAEIAYKKAQTAVLEKIADGSLLKEFQEATSSKPHTTPKMSAPSSLTLSRYYAELAAYGEGFEDNKEFVAKMRAEALFYLKKAATEEPSGVYVGTYAKNF